MPFKNIFISNLAEIAKPLTYFMGKKAKEKELFEDHAYCDRFACSDSDNRVLITPLPLDEEFFADTNRLLNFKNVINLFPKNIEESICLKILSENKLLENIVSIIEKNPGINITSYAATDEFKQLVNYLLKRRLRFQTSELPAQNNFWSAAFFDSKAGFRQMFSSLNNDCPQMPLGFICNSIQEVIGWANYLLKKSQGCVLKINRGLAGEGVEIIKKEDLKNKSLDLLIRSIFTKQSYWLKESVVVEEYISPNMKVCNGAPNIELKIQDKQIKALYTCCMRISKHGVFKGIEFGRQSVPEEVSSVLRKTGEKLGKHLVNFGYRGYFEIDFVIREDGKLYPLEANLRRTGGTHAYELAKRLLGGDFQKKFFIISQMKTEAPRFKDKNYAFIKNRLESLFYPIKGKKEGVILTVLNYLKRGKLGYIVIAPNKDRADNIENKFLNQLF